AVYSVEWIRGPVSVINGDGAQLLITEGKVHAHPGAGPREDRFPQFAVRDILLVEIASAHVDHLLEGVLRPKNELIAGKGVGHERTGYGDPVQLADVEIIGHANVHHGG